MDRSFTIERVAPRGRDAVVILCALRRDSRSRVVPRSRVTHLLSPILLRAADLRWRLHGASLFTAPRATFFVARDARGVIGCGGLCRDDDSTAEIRRIYVRPDARGRGVARELLAALIRAASELGYERVRLETSEYQLEALELYRSSGFEPIRPWGRFTGNSRSRCFELSLRS